MKRYKYILLLLGLFTALQSFAQREYVNLRSRRAAPPRKFEYHQPGSFDIVNGKLNASLASSNGYLFEITEIPVKYIKCGGNLKAGLYKVVLIDSRMDKSWKVSTPQKVSLRINCLKNGGYELLLSGELECEGKIITVDALLSGTVNHSKNIKTN